MNTRIRSLISRVLTNVIALGVLGVTGVSAVLAQCNRSPWRVLCNTVGATCVPVLTGKGNRIKSCKPPMNGNKTKAVSPKYAVMGTFGCGPAIWSTAFCITGSAKQTCYRLYGTKSCTVNANATACVLKGAGTPRRKPIKTVIFSACGGKG